MMTQSKTCRILCIASLLVPVSIANGQTIYVPGGTLGTSNGNAGVGTSTPQAKLEVFANAPSGTVRLNITNSGGTPSAGQLRIGSFPDSAGFHISSNGNPAHTNAPSNAYTADHGSRRAFEILNLNGVAAPDSYTDLRWGIGGTFSTTVRFRADGNVGIGTTNPASKLHVSSAASGLSPMLYAGNSLPQWPVTLQNISGSNTANSSGAVIGLNLENASAAGGTFSPFITFSRKSDSGSYNPTIAAIGGLYTGTGPDANWGAGALTFWTAGAGVYGPLERMRIDQNGNVGIGTTNPTQKLSVNGTIRAKEVIVEASPWPDYVFAADYALPTIDEVAAHIAVEGRLPGVPSAATVAEHGVAVGEMQQTMMRKIEELTLYIIAQDKRIHELEEKVAAQAATTTTAAP